MALCQVAPPPSQSASSVASAVASSSPGSGKNGRRRPTSRGRADEGAPDEGWSSLVGRLLAPKEEGGLRGRCRPDHAGEGTAREARGRLCGGEAANSPECGFQIWTARPCCGFRYASRGEYSLRGEQRQFRTTPALSVFLLFLFIWRRFPLDLWSGLDSECRSLAFLIACAAGCLGRALWPNVGMLYMFY